MLPSKPTPMSPTARPVVPWNKGAFVGPKPPFKPKQVWAIRLTLQREVASATWRCSTSPSTASYAVVTSCNCVSASLS